MNYEHQMAHWDWRYRRTGRNYQRRGSWNVDFYGEQILVEEINTFGVIKIDGNAGITKLSEEPWYADIKPEPENFLMNEIMDDWRHE